MHVSGPNRPRFRTWGLETAAVSASEAHPRGLSERREEGRIVLVGKALVLPVSPAFVPAAAEGRRRVRGRGGQQKFRFRTVLGLFWKLRRRLPSKVWCRIPVRMQLHAVLWRCNPYQTRNKLGLVRYHVQQLREGIRKDRQGSRNDVGQRGVINMEPTHLKLGRAPSFFSMTSCSSSMSHICARWISPRNAM